MYISQKSEVKRGKIRKYKFGVIRKIGELEYEICIRDQEQRENTTVRPGECSKGNGRVHKEL